MNTFTKEVYIVRNDDDIVLSVEFDIEPYYRGRRSGPAEMCYPDEGGNASITKINLVNDDGSQELWNGTLSSDEESEIESEAYTDWEVSQADSYDPPDEYDFVDEDYFHEGRAMAFGED